MAAYTAVISLLQTLEQLELRNPQLIHARTLESLHSTAEYFQLILEKVSKNSRFDPEKIKSLDEIIRVAASDAEDIIELKMLNFLRNEDLLPVLEKMDATTEQVMEIVSNFSTTTYDAIDDDDQILESSSDSIMLKNSEDEIVQGLDDDLEKIVERLRGSQSELDIVTISGMGGIGKTTLARKTHDHPLIRYHFDILVWVTISQDYQSRNVLSDALHCISKQTNIVSGKAYDKSVNDNELADVVQKNLKGQRYLVVVDDIWSTDVWDSISQIFTDYNNRSRILLTTRDTKVAMYANPCSPPHEMNLLNLENSWKLLDKVFGPKHDFPPEFEKIGTKIAKKCQGLPLMISVIAGHLSKMARTLQIWNNVA